MIENMSEELQELALYLFDKGAIQFGDFPLRAGGRTSVYVNLRIKDHPDKSRLLDQDDVKKVASAMGRAAQIYNISFDAICGIPQAGSPIAKEFQKNMLRDVRPPLFHMDECDGEMLVDYIEYVRWLRAKVISRILFIDDVLTTGSSVREARQVVHRARRRGAWSESIRKNFESSVLVVVDRTQGGRVTLAEEGIEAYSLFRLPDLLDFYFEEGRIVEDEYFRAMAEYRKVHFISREMDESVEHGCGD